MELKIRLLRRPVGTVLWLLALAAAVLLLTLGSSLLLSAHRMEDRFEWEHTTIALVADQPAVQQDGWWEPVDNNLYGEDLTLLRDMEQVEFIDQRTLTAAYSPALSPVLSAQTEDAYDEALDRPYGSVVLAGTVLEADCVITEMEAVDLDGWTQPAYSTGDLTARIHVDEVLRANGAYSIPEEIEVFWSFSDPGEDTVLEKGKQYLFYGTYSALDLYYAAQGHALRLPEDDALFHVMPALRLDDGRPLTQTFYLEDGSREFQTRTSVEARLPTFSLLEDSAEAFLNQTENALWAETLKEWDITQHSLPMLGTNRLETMYFFNQNKAVITEGRTFSAEEYESGANVCILSQTVAEQSGLAVGDSIPISQYLCMERDGSIYTPAYQADIHGKLNNPVILDYIEGNGFAAEEETFTIVGLYRLEDWWSDGSYSFTPNVIFVPAGAQASSEATAACGIWLSVKLKNGQIASFREALKGTALEGRLVAFDQGYENAAGSVQAIRSAAEKLMGIVCAAWLLVIALYLVLQQGREQRAIGMMRALGASRRRVRRYLFLLGLIPACIASILGMIGCLLLSERASAQILALILGENTASFHSGGAAIDAAEFSRLLNLPPWTLVFLGAAQLLLLALILWVQAAHLAGKPPRKLMEER